MTSFWQDLRYGAQMLMKHPAFTAVAVLTLALGVGANTALFSVVDAVLLKKLPVKDPDRLVLFKASWNGKKFGPGGFNGSNRVNRETGLIVGTSFPIQTLQRLRRETATLSDVFAFSPMDLNFNAGGQAEVVSGQVVSGNYYSALGVPAVVGRIITDQDDNAGVTPVAVLSHRFWTNRFGADPSVVGKQVNINNVAFTVIGVTSAGFTGTSNVGTAQDVSIPLAWEQQVAGEQSNQLGAGIWWLRLMGRLQPGAGLAQAEATLAGPFQESVLEHRSMRQAKATRTLRNVDPKDLPRLGVDSGSQGEMDSRNGFATPLQLLAAIGLYGVMAYAVSQRTQEIGIRMALGADRRKVLMMIVRQGMTLTVVGVAIGLGGAFVLMKYLESLTNLLFGVEARDPATFVVIAGMLGAVALLACLVPARRATKVDPLTALRYE